MGKKKKKTEGKREEREGKQKLSFFLQILILNSSKIQIMSN